MKLVPNFTQVPNIFFDDLLYKLGYAEVKCLCYIFRRTYGFQKKADNISLSQFEFGITNSKGVVLDNGTGLKRKNIVSALNSLAKMGIVKINRNGSTNSYSLILDYNNEVVTQSNYTSYAEEPEVVTQSNIQKKEKESIQNKDSNGVAISKLLDLFSVVDPKNKTYYGNKTQRGSLDFMINEYGFENVSKVIGLLPQTNQLDYFPRITSPYELKEKWTKLATALQSKKRNEDFSSIMI